LGNDLIFETRSVGRGVNRRHLDTADAFAFHTSNLDVALVTPGGVPGVLDEPVVKAACFVGAIAGNQHAVIKIGAARGAVKDTACVRLEDTLVSLDSD